MKSTVQFPDPNTADDDGLVAVGGGLDPDFILSAYMQGIFPWFGDEDPILWWSPNPRFVLFPERLKVSKSMKRLLRNNGYTITVNRAFEEVIAECSKIKRSGQRGTWITQSMIEAYTTLHQLGYAKSVEVWNGDILVGGLYGIDLSNGVFCGESMFSKESNASKIAFITLIQDNKYTLIDCQVYTNHLESLGAEEIPRGDFLKYLK